MRPDVRTCACPAPRGRSTRRTRRSCRRRRAAAAGDELEHARRERAQERAIVRDEDQRALVVGERARRARAWSTMSRWLVGSSSTSRFGASYRIFASARRARSPPDSTRIGLYTSSSWKPNAPARLRSVPWFGGRRVRPAAPRAPCGRRRAAPSGAARSSPSSPTAPMRDVAAVGRERAGDHLEQRRLAGAVLAHHRPALAAPHDQRRARRGRRARRTPCARPSTLTTSSPERGGARKSNVFSTMRRGGSIFSIFSSFLMRDSAPAPPSRPACLKRSTKRISFASIACWRAYSASRRAASIGARLLVEVVVAGVACAAAPPSISTIFVDDAVHDVAVVAGHHDRAGVVAQEAPRATGSTRGRGSWSARRAAAARARASRICASATRIFQPPDSVPTSPATCSAAKPRPAGSPARAPRARSRRAPGSAPAPRRSARRPRRGRRRARPCLCSSAASSSPSSRDLAGAGEGLGEDRCARAGRRRPGGSSRRVSLRGRSTAPSSGCSSPVIRRNIVVLPAPLGPTSPTFSPGLIWNDASTNRICPPYCLVTEVNEIVRENYTHFAARRTRARVTADAPGPGRISKSAARSGRPSSPRMRSGGMGRPVRRSRTRSGSLPGAEDPAVAPLAERGHHRRPGPCPSA